LLGTREFRWGKKNNTIFEVGGKITYAGGKRYTPIDTAASNLVGYAVMIDALRNTRAVNNYFRADVRIDYKLNTKNVTHEIGLDLVNLFGIKNVYKIRYVGGSNTFARRISNKAFCRYSIIGL